MNCAYCGCPETKHCKGNVVHVSSYGKPHAEHVVRCVSRHCFTVLCDCVAYVAPATDAR